ncbi:MAG: hypothetical protein J7L08_01290 [Candidatus Aenigmarchaeota archaeon]|nr:hypothetical protein [Candidatus Aenigmarchaeota archaeon]
MLIGVDLDEVISDTLPALIKFHNERYGTNLKKEDFYSYRFEYIWGGTREEAIRKVLEFYKSKYYNTIKPVEGALEGIKKLREKNELVVITYRPTEFKEITEEWLKRYFHGCFSKIYFTNFYSVNGTIKKKYETCLEIGVDLMIDDLLKCSLDCASRNISVLLFNQPWNQCKELPALVKRVYSWKEIIENVKPLSI